MSPLVFVSLTGHPDRLPIVIRLDQIVAVTTRPKRADVERDITVLEGRLASYRDEDDPLFRADQCQLDELERERDEPRAGSRVWLLDDLSFTVTESSQEVIHEMETMMRIAEMS